MLKVKTMTNKQSAIFSKMLDTNWTVKELMEAGKYNEARIVSKEHHDLVNELKKSMGESKYNEFIDNGRKMFS
jgi:hypothetical protein